MHQNDPTMTRAPSKSGTDEQLQPEPHSEASNHSGDSPADDGKIQSHPAGSHEASQGSSISIDPTAKSEGHQGTGQSLGLPGCYYSLSRYLHNQYDDEWIDELDSFGGQIVRAAIENASPNVWDCAIDARRHFIGRTYHMERSLLEERSGNPKNARATPSGRVRRAARLRAKKARGGG